MSARPTVSAIVVNHSRRELLDACLRSLREAIEHAAVPGELIVVDNGSDDGSVELVRDRHPEAAVVAFGENRGFATAVGAGIRRSRGDWVLLLNNDATAHPDAVAQMLAAGRSAPDVGSVAAQLRFADTGTINSAGIAVDRLGVAYDRLLGAPPHRGEPAPVEVFGASGGAALYRRSMLDDLGGFDERFFVYMEDADLAWRARMRGWRCLYVAAAVVDHHHSATATHGSPFKYLHVGLNRVRLLAKNADRSLLVRYGLAMLAYDMAYCVFVALTDRTLAPVRGRLRGLAEWRSFRGGAGERRSVELDPPAGLRAAAGRSALWRSRTSGA